MNLPASIKKITTKVPTCRSDQKTSDVREYLLKNMAKFETVNYIYVLTRSNRLKGVISIQELFSRSPDSHI
ncbi:MAG TPA: hypothetical protein ENN58_01865, partial [bacterium]|nr:hypothetical protein [bacterium]